MEFLKQHASITVGLISGVFSALLMIRAATLTTDKEALLFWIGAYVCMGVASFALWRKGRKELEVQRQQGATREKELLEQIADSRLLSQDRRDKAAIRAELNQLIEESVDLRKKIMDSHQMSPPDQFKSVIDDWQGRAFAFVEKHFPEFTGHYRSDAGLMIVGFYVGSQERSQAIRSLERRSVRLSELLRKLSSTGGG